MILAIDPGPELSAYVLYDETKRALDSTGWKGASHGKVPNAQLLDMVQTKAKHGSKDEWLAIEMIASYGMPVGREVFETCVAIGHIERAWFWERLSAPQRIYRSQVKNHLCGSMRAKDSNVRQALLDAFGGKEKAVGSKAKPGPLYGIKGDCWSALAVAITFADMRDEVERAA